MKRTELTRKTPLRTKSPIKRGGPIKWSPNATKAKKKRRTEKAERFKDLAVPLKVPETDRPYLDWIKTLPCTVCGCNGVGFDAVDPAHTETVKTGGSDRRAIPLCRLHHSEQGTMGVKTFASEYKFSYNKVIADLNAKYEAR